ncbi:MAG: signal peptidase II [Firmicutes bacterium]|nr:signal peptidase II [Bacillota bacterium]
MENLFLIPPPNSKKQRILNYFKRTWKLEWVIIFGAIFLDVFTKFLIARFIEYRIGMVTLLPNFLEIVHFRNYAAAVGFNFFNFFGMFGSYPTQTQARIFFIVFISITISAFIFYMVWGNKNRRLFRIALALIIGGALGNLYCRIFHGAVRDWIQVRFLGMTIFGYRTFPVFNLADAFLIVGVATFLIYFFKDWTKDEKDKTAAKEARKKVLTDGEFNDNEIINEEIIVEQTESKDVFIQQNDEQEVISDEQSNDNS